MIKAKPLKRGSKIAIISPSNGLPAILPDIYELGLQNLEELFGFQVVEYPTARMPSEELYHSPKQRAEDINKAFGDDTIDGIICSIGGYESVRILKYLDLDVILKHPKMIMGFSDATTFLTYLNQEGLVTFYGPAVMAGLAQLKHIDDAYKRHIEDMLIHRQVPYTYTPYTAWSHGYKDWSVMETLGQCTTFYKNEHPMAFLQQGKPGDVKGYLWGGCIEVLEFLKGTSYWPETSFFQDKILFFETSEEKPSPTNVGYMLRNYGIMGVLHQIKGILFGRPKDYSDEENKALHGIIKNILEIEFGVTDIPVMVDVDIGHTDPKWIIPLGCQIRINAIEKSITLEEHPFG
ncbi:LD-carboxypeptidase [Vallitalea pronyensis]|uniref:LD-carboxypeptidase n=1 Tax=Vallitalea pronyensis TaxID=1348613 RepID=A0A8J8MJA0_9FIRM|nr:S66 peptidase family protein [Vallitalea pronyensis]QUI22710.1 LD-carboxypeptidase [Vallitalea pronyensis]